MRARSIIALLGALWLQPAHAQTHQGCTAAQSRVIDDAIAQSHDLTLAAAVAVGNTAQYVRWFGAYDRAQAETVRATLKSIVAVLRSGAVTVQCDLIVDDPQMVGCAYGEYAWVYPHEPYLLHICPAFFTLPTLNRLRPGLRHSEHGTREGTIIHELSHFPDIAETLDHCYTRRECAQMALSDTARAVMNADSYQYFTEDVMLYARRLPDAKPAPAARP